MTSEKSIDFSCLSPSEFEELCFDLILNFQYEDVLWREGSTDDGRDIEATQRLVNPLTYNYSEKWFFECKRHATGVSVEDLNTKILWADAMKPDHLVFITSSHFTTQCLRWIESITPNKMYRLHTINGAYLKRLIAKTPKIYNKYFTTPIERLFLESKNNWLIHNILPSRDTVSLLFDSIHYESLTNADKCHLLYYIYNESPLYLDEEKQSALPIEIEKVTKKLKETLKRLTSNVPAFLDRKEMVLTSKNLRVGTFSKNEDEFCISAELTIKREEGVVFAQYFLCSDASTEAVEFLLIKSSDFCAETSFISNYSQQYSDGIFELLQGVHICDG